MAATDPRTALAALSAPARALLRLLSFLAPAPFPRTLLAGDTARPFVKRALALANDAATATARGEAVALLSPALDELISSGLISSADDALAATDDVLSATRMAIPLEQQRAWTEVALGLANALAPEDTDDPATWPGMRVLRPHLGRVLGHAEREGIAEPTGHLMGEKLGVFVFAQGDRAEASRLMERALEIDLARFGEDSPAVGVDITNLSFALRRQGREDDARLLRRRAVEIFRACGEAEALHLVVALGNLADAGDNPDEAEPLYREAIELAGRFVGESHRVTARALRKLAGLLIAKAEVLAETSAACRAEAVALLRRALAVDERACGPDHSFVADDLEELARALGDAAPADERIALLKRALAIHLAWPDADPSGRDRARRALAPVLRQAGRGREARALELDKQQEDYERQLAIRPGDTRLLNEYAMFLKNERRDYAGAERAYRKALEVRPDAIILGNLAVLLAGALDRPDEAEQAFMSALELAPEQGSLLANFAFLVQNHRRDLDAAEQLYRMALEHSPHDSNAHSNYASLLIVAGRGDEAAAHLREAWVQQAAAGHDRVSARILILGVLLARTRGADTRTCLGRLKTLFAQGIAHAPWAAGGVLDWLPQHLPAEDDGRCREMIRAMVDPDACARLEASAWWTALPALPLAGPWEMVTEI
jgi:tetratricopeptide (TPR) repeat protein